MKLSRLAVYIIIALLAAFSSTVRAVSCYLSHRSLLQFKLLNGPTGDPAQLYRDRVHWSRWNILLEIWGVLNG